MIKKHIQICCVILVAGMCVACGSKKEAEPEVEVGVGMPNPRVEHASKEELQNALGFMMPDYPSNFQMKEPVYGSIDHTLGEIQEQTKDGNAVTIRKASGEEDISGYFGVTYEEAERHGVKVHVGTYEDTSVMRWTNDGYSYALAIEGLTGDELVEYQTVLLTEAGFQQEMQQELPGARAVYRTVPELNEALGYAVIGLPKTYQLDPAVIGVDAGGEGYLRYRKGMENDAYIDVITVSGADYKHSIEEDMTLTETEVLGVKVQTGLGKGLMEGLRYGRWNHGEHSYAVVALGQTAEEFDGLLSDLVNISKN